MQIDWGDVPSWIGVLLAIVVPVVAYLERNRIISFVRRKTAEPLPQLPPARFVIRPRPGGQWLVLNQGEGEAFNVRLDVEDASASILTSGFWQRFLPVSYATFNLQLSRSTLIYPDVATTDVLVSWQDAHGEQHVERFALNSPSMYNLPKLEFPLTEPGKVMPLGLLGSAAEAGEDEGGH